MVPYNRWRTRSPSSVAATEGAEMDVLAYLPMPAPTEQDDTGQPLQPTTREYLRLVPDPDADVEAQVISEIEAARVRRLVGTLERFVIVWHFGLHRQKTLSRKAIAKRLRLSTSVVRRIEGDALRELRSLSLGEGKAA